MCVVKGCQRHDIAAKGLCWPHYQRQRRGSSDLSAVRDYRPRGECEAEGCERTRAGTHYCSAHESRYKKYGDPLAEYAIGDLGRMYEEEDECAEFGCHAKPIALGLCGKHYAHWRYHNVPGVKERRIASVLKSRAKSNGTNLRA